jgi:hypothetical protein
MINVRFLNLCINVHFVSLLLVRLRIHREPLDPIRRIVLRHIHLECLLKIVRRSQERHGLLRVHSLVQVLYVRVRGIHILFLAHGKIGVVSLGILAKLLNKISSLHFNLLSC